MAMVGCHFVCKGVPILALVLRSAILSSLAGRQCVALRLSANDGRRRPIFRIATLLRHTSSIDTACCHLGCQLAHCHLHLISRNSSVPCSSRTEERGTVRSRCSMRESIRTADTASERVQKDTAGEKFFLDSLCHNVMKLDPVDPDRRVIHL